MRRDPEGWGCGFRPLAALRNSPANVCGRRFLTLNQHLWIEQLQAWDVVTKLATLPIPAGQCRGRRGALH